MAEKQIVILTKNFGYNFTGATVATHTLIQKWSKYDEASNITVLTLNVGKYNATSKLKVVKANSNKELRRLAFQHRNEHTIFYSDDHLGYLLKDLPYVHTYHGNWPDARFINPEMFVKSIYFINRYGATLRNAAAVVNVSRYMKKFTDRFNRRSVVIRNGVSEHVQNSSRERTGNKVLMIGSLESRKYGQLPELLKVLPQNIQIDAYGNIIDKRLEEELDKYPNFSAKGFVKFEDIQLEKYACFLSLSVMENMPISLVEVLRSEIPVVAYAVGGIPEIVNNNCGILFNKDESKMKISKAIQDAATGKKRYSMENSELKQFDWNIAAERYLKLFKNVLERVGEEK